MHLSGVWRTGNMQLQIGRAGGRRWCGDRRRKDERCKIGSREVVGRRTAAPFSASPRLPSLLPPPSMGWHGCQNARLLVVWYRSAGMCRWLSLWTNFSAACANAA